MRWLRKKKPEPIAISAMAAEKLRALKMRRPLSQEENLCIATLAWQLGVPEGWRFDDERMCFVPPDTEG